MRKWPDRRHWQFTGLPLGEDAYGTWLFTPEGNVAQRGSEPPITLAAVLDALEARYPMLCGTSRDQTTQQRRAFVRFFASEQDFSHEAPDTPLPDAVASGTAPFMIVGAIAGG